eukprot:CAMPEP_0196760334 /NCGR_PEP_ID=MMETSP1091-20130531/105165_1 /TAXON_ID=302021 /ORGANISM="Rhodomonas sp., Strain CCMP768" /LENGTH=294 /DNA_ID=CAMNT_0042109217 /DNA_START=23 /DNA_END=905 /DNA_ORIENTATION=+
MEGVPAMQDPAQVAQITQVLQEACTQARHAVELNPNDHGAYAKWGEVLLELSMMKTGQEAVETITQSIAKLEKSLEIYPDNANALVVHASALNARAFLQHDSAVAQELFDKSKVNFQKALRLEPENQRYKELLDAMEKAPELHAQVVAQMQAQGGMPGASKGLEDGDWVYDYIGWGILIVGGITLIAVLNNQQAAEIETVMSAERTCRHVDEPATQFLLSVCFLMPERHENKSIKPQMQAQGGMPGASKGLEDGDWVYDYIGDTVILFSVTILWLLPAGTETETVVVLLPRSVW